MKIPMQNKKKVILNKLNKFKAIRLIELLIIFITGLLSVILTSIFLGWIINIIFDILKIGSRHLSNFIAILLLITVETILIRKIIHNYKLFDNHIKKLAIVYIIIAFIIFTLYILFTTTNLKVLYFLVLMDGLIFILIFEHDFINLVNLLHPIKTAEELETRIGFNGELISTVDFITGDYNHNKDLEKLFISGVESKLKKFNPVKFFQINNIKNILLFIFIPFLLILSGQLLFSYRPSDFISNISNPYVSMNAVYVLSYNQEVLFGEEFSLYTKTNADMINIKVNYEGRTYNYTPEKYHEKFNLNKNEIFKNIYSPNYTSEMVLDNETNSGRQNNFETYTFYMPNVDSDFTFRIIYSLDNNKEMVEGLDVKLIYLPEIDNISYSIKYPDSYNLNDYNVSGDGNIQAFKGSSVRINIKSNNSLKSATLLFINNDNQDQSSYDMIINDRNRLNAQVEIPIVENGSYYINLVDFRDNSNENITRYIIGLIDDIAPYVELIEPKNNITTKDIDKIGIKAYVQDDILINKVEVLFDIYKDNKIRKSGSYPININRDRVVNINQSVDFIKLGIKRGESLDFMIKATDSNNQSGFSEKITITYPDEYDVMTNIKSLQNAEEDRLESMLEEQKKLTEEIDKLRKDSKSIENQSDNLKKVEELIKRQEELIREINKTQQNLNQIKNLTEEENLSSEVSEKINELNKLLNELNRHKAEHTLKQLEEVLENEDFNLSPNDADSMNEEEYIKRLEKAIEKMQKMMDLSLLVESEKIADDLIKLVDEVNHQIEERKNISDEQLKNITDMSNKIESNLENISTDEMINDTENINQLIKEINTIEIPDFKNEVKPKTNKDNALSKGQSLKQNYENLKNDLNGLIENMRSQDFTEILNYLNSVIKEFIELSKDLNRIYEKSTELEEKLKFVRQEELSVLIEEILFIRSTIIDRGNKFDNLFEGVLEIEAKSAMVGEFMRIGRFLYDTADEVNHKRFFSSIRMLDYSSNNLGSLTMTLIKLKMQIKDSSNSQQQGDSGQQNSTPKPSPNDSGMNSLAEAQKQLTETMKDFIGNKKEGELTNEEKEYLKEMSEEQRAIGERFRDKFGDRVSREKEEMMNRIDEIEEEIEKIADDIESLNDKDNITERQNMVLERMINTNEGIEGDKLKKEREAQQALNKVLDKGNQKEMADKLKELLSKQDVDKLIEDDSLSPEYIQFIIDYFNGIKE